MKVHRVGIKIAAFVMVTSTIGGFASPASAVDLLFPVTGGASLTTEAGGVSSVCFVTEDCNVNHTNNGYWDQNHKDGFYSIDLSAAGATIVSAGSGRVVYSGQITVDGKLVNAIDIYHGNGYFTEYLEFGSFGSLKPVVGTMISQGVPMGTLNQGNNEHLHFQVKYNPALAGASDPFTGINDSNQGSFRTTYFGTGLSSENVATLKAVTVGGRQMTDYRLARLDGALPGALPLEYQSSGRPANKPQANNALDSVLNDLRVVVDSIKTVGNDLLLRARRFVEVGKNGTGELDVTGGGKVTSAVATLGVNPGTSGTVVLSGAGSSWTNSRPLVSVPGDGPANFTVGDNGRGSLTVRDSALLKNEARTDIGKNGIGELTVEAGGRLTNDGSFGIGGRFPTDTGTGSATIRGASSLLEVGTFLDVGIRSGTGTLTISDGGTVHTGQLLPGGSASNIGVLGGNGTMIVSGTGSAYIGNDQLNVANSGGLGVATQGSFQILAGGSVQNRTSTVGASAGDVGQVIVDGRGSNWVVLPNEARKGAARVIFGQTGKGILDQRNEATLTTTELDFGFNALSRGEATLSGAGTKAILRELSGNPDGFTPFLGVGISGNGRVEIRSGAQVLVDSVSSSFSGFTVGRNAGSTGTLIVSGVGSSIVSTNARSGNDGSLMQIGRAGEGVLVINNGGQVKNDPDGISMVGRLATGIGSVAVNGNNSLWDAGRLLLVGRNFDFTRGTTFDQGGFGTVNASNGGVVEADLIEVGRNGKLQGDGTFRGNVRVMGGVIAPGNSPGTMTIDGDFVFDSGLLELEAFSPTLQDHFVIMGNAIFGGGLIKIFLGYTPTMDQILDFFDVQGSISILPDFLGFEAFTLFGSGVEGGAAVSFQLGSEIFRTQIEVVPAPTTLLLLALGCVLLVTCRAVPRASLDRPLASATRLQAKRQRGE